MAQTDQHLSARSVAAPPIADAPRERVSLHDGLLRLAAALVWAIAVAVSLPTVLAWLSLSSSPGFDAAALVLIVASLAVAACAAYLYAGVLARRRVRGELAVLHDQQRQWRDESAAIAHDLRAPLLTIRSYLELMADESFGPMPPSARQAAERAARASTRAQSLVEWTLERYTADLAQAGTRSPGSSNHQPTARLDRVLKDVLVTLDAEISRSGARVKIGRLPRVCGSSDQLHRVFENLLQNAIKYARPGGAPRIEVSAALDGRWCALAVRDHGVGIAARERSRVFRRGERGAQGDGPATGAGIGLATVHDVVSALGGRVWIDSEVSDGTCVRLLLPMEKP